MHAAEESSQGQAGQAGPAEPVGGSNGQQGLTALEQLPWGSDARGQTWATDQARIGGGTGERPVCDRQTDTRDGPGASAADVDGTAPA